MEGLTFEQTPSAPIGSPKRNAKRFFYLLATIVVIGLLLFGGFKLFGGSNKSATSEITPTPTEFITETPFPTESTTPTPTSTPTATKTPTPTVKANPVDSATGLDRSTLDVSIQNGSGETGVAKTASDYLSGLGYNIVSTGNAATTNFTNITIQVKSTTKSGFLTLLKNDLSAKYTVGTTSSDLSASSSTDALVVIGK